MNSAVPTSSVAAKRPGLVWVIIVLYAVGLVVSLGSLYAAVTGALHLPERAAAFYARFGTLNFLGIAASAIISTAFLVELVRMRKSAAYLATAGFVVMIAKDLWYAPELMKFEHWMASLIIGPVISLLIVCYMWHLKRTGVLR